jgi:SAM-dependent methyltransferase
VCPNSHNNDFQEHLERLSSLNAAAMAKDRESFIKNEKAFLYPLEREELGNVAGKSLLHLQCRSGLDTLSWSMLDARTVGVDFDEVAIKQANDLAQIKHLHAEFWPINIYDLPKNLPGPFDIVYTAYGVLFWLEDLGEWARLIAHYLAPNGTFYIVDYHPTANLFDEGFDASDSEMPQLRYPFNHIQYQHHSRKQPLPQFEYRGAFIWNYALSDVLNALVDAELRVLYMHEHEYMFTQRFEQMEQDEQGHWRWRDPACHVPLLFSLKATRP